MELVWVFFAGCVVGGCLVWFGKPKEEELIAELKAKLGELEAKLKPAAKK